MNFYKFWKYITNQNSQVFQTPFTADSVLQNGLGMNAEGHLGTILIVEHKRPFSRLLKKTTVTFML